ncbi:MAG: biopolymer transporter ExbD [Phycisphaera sp.]|nr:biopolymer transporter ExbD [Phycisphaera sp.]
MRFGGRKPRERQLPLDMTPMIDIVFQLLIFFLVTAQLSQYSRADLDLPEEAGEKTDEASEAGLIINVLADGTLEIASAEISVEELRILAIDLVAESDGSVSPARPLVRADRNAPTASLNKVLSTLQRAGIPAVRIATAPGN